MSVNSISLTFQLQIVINYPTMAPTSKLHALDPLFNIEEKEVGLEWPQINVVLQISLAEPHSIVKRKTVKKQRKLCRSGYYWNYSRYRCMRRIFT